ncbi:MAG: N-formylglutamate deformylase [Novosphingobium sp.]|uniref:N-formylglutamate deformylase n=1 Tax=Novosphingobium sp. TaxID=1874826 RepID=UPI0032BB211F
MSGWLKVQRGDAPLIVAFPHGGTELGGVEPRFASAWLAQRDADWWIADLYDFAADLGATTVSTVVSRSVIDVNRDPSGASLYPGMATTELCPTTTFDGAPLYRSFDPEEDEIGWRRKAFFDPYHAALAAEITRLRALHPRVVLYDAHSIRSRIARLFDGELPQFNLGTNGGTTCDPLLEAMLTQVCDKSGYSWIANGRFKGGWTTRHYGSPQAGVHGVQMELAMRGYMAEPDLPDEANWPGALHQSPEILPTLRALIGACLTFAEGSN